MDELVVLPSGRDFCSNLVSESRTCVLFASTGMLNTLRRFRGTRVHISVDTKMPVLKRQLGVATVVLQTKGDRQLTSFHRVSAGARAGGKGVRIQHKAFTTQGKPVLQAVSDEESEPNHASLFSGLGYMWTLAHPAGPPLPTVVFHVAKDFAHGFEAGRRKVFPCARPFDDFFHFVGHTTEMTARCKTLRVTPVGKFYKLHWNYASNVLHATHNFPTADMVDQPWPAFLRRLCGKSEPLLALYLFQHYTSTQTVAQLNAMHVHTNCGAAGEVMYFLSWWGGMGVFPGFDSGNSTSEALHSPWESVLKRQGRNLEVEEALTQIQSMYRDKWRQQYARDSDAPLDNFPHGDIQRRCQNVICARWTHRECIKFVHARGRFTWRGVL